jgi:hypothetical protein
MILLDFANTILIKTGSEFYRVSIFYRAAIELFILFYFVSRGGFRKQYRLLISLFSCFVIGHSILLIHDSDLDIFQAVITVNKYLFFVILSIPFLFFENDEYFTRDIKRLFEFFFVLNSVLIIFGTIFDVRVLSSYYDPSASNLEYQPRFGYKGIIPAQNELTGVYFFGLAYYFRAYFSLKEKKGAVLALIIVAAFLTGTKGCIFSVLGLSILYLSSYRKNLLFGVCLPIFFLLAMYWGNDLIEYLSQSLYSHLVYSYESNNLLTFLLSGRDLGISRCFDYISKYWTFVNYVFGGFDMYKLSSEMDMFDIYFFLGVGMIPFLIYYLRIFFHRVRSTESYFVFLVYFIIIFGGGHILGSAIVPMFLLIYVFTGRAQLLALQRSISTV